MNAESFGARYDDLLKAPPMRSLYGDSGYFNIGYWEDGATDLVTACDRMVDEMASTVPENASFIVDVGCGIGAGTRRLTDRFPDALVLGVNISHWQLVRARQRGVTAAVMDATHLAIASGSADAVIAIESAHCFNPRTDFFAEAFRVLRPGGTLAVADMLFRDAQPIGDWIVPSSNHIDSLEQYRASIAAAGFEVNSVRDIADASWARFCDAMRTVFPGRESRVDEIRDSLACYALAFARKP